MVHLRLVWLFVRSVEKIPILGQRKRCFELVTFRRIQVSQCVLERDCLERLDDGGGHPCTPWAVLETRASCDERATDSPFCNEHRRVDWSGRRWLEACVQCASTMDADRMHARFACAERVATRTPKSNVVLRSMKREGWRSLTRRETRRVTAKLPIAEAPCSAFFVSPNRFVRSARSWRVPCGSRREGPSSIRQTSRFTVRGRIRRRSR